MEVKNDSNNNEKVIIVEQKSNESLKKVLNSTIKTIIIVLLICLIVFLSFKMYNLKNDESTRVTDIEFKNIGQLVTQEATVTVVENYKNSREFLKMFDIPFTEYVLIFSCEVNVEAYIDFEKVHYTEENNKFIVELPHAEYKKPNVDKSTIKKEYDNKNIFNSVGFDKSNELIKKVEDKAAKIALKNGLLEKAEKNAEKVIENMLKSDKNHKNYEVEWNYIGG